MNAWKKDSHYLAAALFTIAALALGACGDITSSVGEKGRVIYSLYTVYESDSQELTKVDILTRHQQRINTMLTSQGDKDIGDPGVLKHKMSPSDGVTIEQVDDGYDVPDVRITVTTPGTYALETYEDDELFDRVKLHFEHPVELSLVTWMSAADEDDFSKKSGDTISASTGSQVTFVPIPKGADGQRILGDISFNMESDPTDAAVRVKNLLGVYEDGIVYHAEPVSFVLMQSGTITITIADSLAPSVKGTKVFDVAP